jgi:protoporphyrin/coproporphyrin ferrochelatase
VTSSTDEPSTGTSKPIDVLLLQLGTPNAPTAAALRPYLREFLNDGRVLELRQPWRWFLVNLVIAPFRSGKSAVKYRRIWNDVTGSPLLEITRRQTAKLANVLGDGFRVRFAMRYGKPSTASVVRCLAEDGCNRLIAVPMYPQYSATTTASAFDAMFRAWENERIVPSIRTIRDYHLDEGYLNAVEENIRRNLEAAKALGEPPQQIVVSFHGIPIDYVKRGDPYMRQCAETAKEIARRFGWKKGDWKLVFQSRLGRQKWLTPYFDETIKELGKAGLKSVFVTQPGFTADCLETIDEIGNEGREDFEGAGGKRLHRAPCLNDDAEFIDALAAIVRRESQGWV